MTFNEKLDNLVKAVNETAKSFGIPMKIAGYSDAPAYAPYEHEIVFVVLNKGEAFANIYADAYGAYRYVDNNGVVDCVSDDEDETLTIRVNSIHIDDYFTPIGRMANAVYFMALLHMLPTKSRLILDGEYKKDELLSDIAEYPKLPHLI